MLEKLSRKCNPSTNFWELKNRRRIKVVFSIMRIDDEVYAKEIILEVKNQ